MRRSTWMHVTSALAMLVAAPAHAAAEDARAARVFVAAAEESARFASRPGEALELVFPNGSSVLLLDRAEAVVPAAQAGAPLRVRLSGAARISVGRDAMGLIVETDRAVLHLERGVASIDAGDAGVRAALVFGGALRVSAHGRDRVVTRPGREIWVGAAGASSRRQTRAQALADARGRANKRAEPSQSRPSAFDGLLLAALDDNDVLGAVAPPPRFQRSAAATLSAASGIGLGASAQVYVQPVDQGLSGNAQFSAFGAALGAQPVVLQGGMVSVRPGQAQPPRTLRTTNRLTGPNAVFTPPASGDAFLRRSNNTAVSYGVMGPLDLSAADPVFDGILQPFDRADVIEALSRMNVARDTDGDGRDDAPCDTQGCAEFARFVELLMLGQSDLKIVVGSALDTSPIIQAGDIVPLVNTNQMFSIPRTVLSADRDGLAQRGVRASGLRVVNGLTPALGINGANLSSNIEVFDLDVSVLQAGFDVEDADGDGRLRRDDHFLMVEARPDRLGIDRFVFATGGVGPIRAAADTIDVFQLLTGLEGLANGQAPGSGGLGAARAFVPGAADAFGLGGFRSTPLYVANAADAAGQNAVFHADLGIGADGRVSSVSATFGRIDYLTDDVRVQGRTVGSSRLAGQGRGEAASLIVSPLTNTSYGGGLRWNGTTQRPGYAGYLVLENVAEANNGGFALGGVSTTIPDLTDASAFAGGSVRPPGAAATRYGVLRLAVGTTSTPAPDRDVRTYGGFLAGLVETEGAGGVSAGFLDSGGVAGDPGRLVISTNAADNRVTVRAILRGADGADLPAIDLGGQSGPSAFIQGGVGADAIYGAASRGGAGHDAALVSGDALDAAPAAGIGPYRHVQWGYFFGDVVDAPGARQHTHLASWAAGEVLSPTAYALRGSARFSGHAIGSVADAQGLRTVFGSFTQQWSFDARTGQMTLTFDGQTYRAPALAFADLGVDLRYRGLFDETAGRAGQVDGVLVGRTEQGRPGGTVGQFGIQSLAGQPGYVASGTFGGDIIE